MQTELLEQSCRSCIALIIWLLFMDVLSSTLAAEIPNISLMI